MLFIDEGKKETFMQDLSLWKMDTWGLQKYSVNHYKEGVSDIFKKKKSHCYSTKTCSKNCGGLGKIWTLNDFIFFQFQIQRTDWNIKQKYTIIISSHKCQSKNVSFVWI